MVSTALHICEEAYKGVSKYYTLLHVTPVMTNTLSERLY